MKSVSPLVGTAVEGLPFGRAAPTRMPDCVSQQLRQLKLDRRRGWRHCCAHPFM